MRGLSAIAILIFTCIACARSVSAEEGAQSFYRGKTLTVIVSAGVGGGYDAYARPLGRHLARHIPGEPTVIIQNMEGGGGLRAMNYLANAAPKDGTMIGLVHSTIPFAPLLGLENANFDPTKINWIGSMNYEPQMCIAREGSKIKNFNDVFEHEFVVGSVGAGAGEEIYPLAMNRLLGTKFRVINGYKSGNEILLAIERGEIDGRCALPIASLRSSRPNWVSEKKVRYIVQTSLARSDDPVLSDTPMVTDHARDENQRQTFELLFANQRADKPIIAPPGTPEKIVNLLRQSLADMMKDRELLAELEKGRLSANFVSGFELETLIRRAYSSSPAVIEMARQAIRP
jgi:tripartite-type tricarboxylate transporter receptor subunit TctC